MFVGGMLAREMSRNACTGECKGVATVAWVGKCVSMPLAGTVDRIVGLTCMMAGMRMM